MLDIMMPEMDGYEACIKLKSDPRTSDIPIIFLTAKTQDEDEQKGFELGAVDYITKPISPPTVLARVKTHLQLKKARDVLKEKNAALLASRQALAAELAQAADYVVSLMPPPLSSGPSPRPGAFSPAPSWAATASATTGSTRTPLPSISSMSADTGSARPCFPFRPSTPSAPRRFRTRISDSPSVLAALNDAFHMEHHNNLYFTIWYGVFDRRTRQLRFASGGHPPAFLISKEGTLAKLMTNNLFIGGLPESTYQGNATTVPPGAHLYVFSDGVYEVDPPVGNMWTLEELGAYLLTTDWKKAKTSTLCIGRCRPITARTSWRTTSPCWPSTLHERR